MSGEKLYTPELLALAVALAGYRFDETLPLRGNARSRTCGSTLAIALETDRDERIGRLGMRVAACAVGQAAAAIFAQKAEGHDATEIAATVTQIESWLGDDGPQPEWPGFDLLAPARVYPARHGAILLPWRAAMDALCVPAPRN